MSITSPRFNFFDREILKDPEKEGHNFDKFKELDVTSSSAGRGQILIGDREGTVFILDKLLNITAFRAHTRSISHVHQLRQSNILFTVGEDDDMEYPVCKVWLMDRMDSHGTPHCSRIITLSATGGNAEVACIAVHENMQFLAVGYKSGVVTLHKGDVTKDRQSKRYVILDSEDDSAVEITGLALRVVHRSQLLFVTTRTSLLAYDFSVKDKHTLVLKENYGCSLKCCTLSDDLLSNQFLIGRNDGVYYIQPEGRGGTAPLEGEKYQVHWYRGYVVTVGRSSINRDMDIVTIYDALNKFIAYSGAIPKVSNVLFEWNAIYILGGDNKMYMLLEKATRTKLEILFKKNQYITAINIAKSQKYDAQGLVDIFRLYGDYLYTERGEHDQAIEQYKMTIGKLEPSYVIRKFLDAQRLHNLTSYLEELHNKHCATEDHTTLLLNCYTKLKDQEKLDEFIQKKDRNNEVYFDIETAIRVLRQSDYHSHALQLAERHSQHEWYMKIQLENIKDFGAALRYMQNLPFDEAESSLKKYGKVLIQALPSETTSLLKRLCLGQYSDTARARPDEFIHIFVNNSSQLTEFLEAMISSEQTPDAAVIYNTLLELYLQSWAKLDPKTQPLERSQKADKAMSLLKNSTHYAKDQALVLCQLYKFDSGILYLYEYGCLYQQIVRYYMDHNEYDEVIVSCKMWGDKDPHVWVMALSYFAGKENDFKLQMKEVLRNIDEQKLLPPLLVIQTLANSKVCTLGVVKDFIMDRLLTENDEIEREEKLIREYVDETQTLRQKIQDLKTKPQVFQTSRCCVCKYQLELPSVHFLCQHSYHTSCFDSYAENENECPVCLEDNRKMLETIKQHERNKDSDLVKSFTEELRNTKDGFGVVASYFGKGIFNKVTLLSESSSARSTKDAADDPYLTSPATAKVTGRHNPFSREGDVDMGSAGTFRRSSQTSSSAMHDSSFPLHKDTAPLRQSQPANTMSSVSSPSATRANIHPRGGNISTHSGSPAFSDIDVISTRPKQRVVSSSAASATVKPKSTANMSGFDIQKDNYRDQPRGGHRDGQQDDHRNTQNDNLRDTHKNNLRDTHRDDPRDSQRDSGRSTPVPVISVTPVIKAASNNPPQSSPSLTRVSTAPAQSLNPATSKKGRSGHSRQSSAGKIIESGLSFFKGHARQSSDQTGKMQKGSTPPASKSTSPAPKSTSAAPKSTSPAPNPFENETAKNSSNPFAEKTTSHKPVKPKQSALNPFEDKPANPFEDKPANPFEESSNPFMEDDSVATANPFGEENTNPFEE